MSNIRIGVEGQKLYLDHAPIVASEGVNENYMIFNFDDSWAGFGKTALFYREGDEENVYTAAVDGDGRALVPWEVTKEDGKICFGLCGAKNDIIYTTEILTYKIVKGMYTEGQESATPPTPDIYQQMLTVAGDMQLLYLAEQSARKRADDDFNRRLANETRERQMADSDLGARDEVLSAQIANLIVSPPKVVSGALKLQTGARQMTNSWSTGTHYNSVIQEFSLAREFAEGVIVSTRCLTSSSSYTQDEINQLLAEPNKWYSGPNDVAVFTNWDETSAILTVEVRKSKDYALPVTTLVAVTFAVPATIQEIIDARVDYEGKTHLSLGLAIRSQARAAKLERNAIVAEIADARTDADGQAHSTLGEAMRAPFSEVFDARLGADGVTYPTLGDAIRTQIENLASAGGEITTITSSFFNYLASGFGLVSTGSYVYKQGRRRWGHVRLVTDGTYSHTNIIENNGIKYYSYDVGSVNDDHAIAVGTRVCGFVTDFYEVVPVRCDLRSTSGKIFVIYIPERMVVNTTEIWIDFDYMVGS